MKKVYVVAIMFLIVFLTGCTDDKYYSRINDLETRIEELELENIELKEVILEQNQKSVSDFSNEEINDMIIQLDEKYKVVIELLLFELEQLPEWEPITHGLFKLSLTYQNDLLILNPDDSNHYYYFYVGQINDVRFYRGSINREVVQYCTQNIVSPASIGNGYYIPGGHSGCYTITLAVKDNIRYKLSGESSFDITQLNLTAEEICSIEWVCEPQDE